MDFLTDALADGRRFRVLTFVENVSRVSPAIGVDFSLTGEWVVAILDALRPGLGVPERIAIDNGPEFISKALDAWAYRHGVQLEFSRLGKPTDNAFAESFNARFRDECLDQHWFASLEEARQTIEAWRVEDQHRTAPSVARATNTSGLGGCLVNANGGARLTFPVDQIGGHVTTGGLS
jgi:putative transposase